VKDVLLFAGTEEGRKIAVYLERHGMKTHVCVATSYGESLLKDSIPKNSHVLEITSEPLDKEQIKTLLERNEYHMVIDATHPYAQEVTRNCKAACEECDIPYYRVVRESLAETGAKIHEVESVEDAVAYLQHTEGNILVTTGSKEMEGFLSLEDQKERIYYRVLSTVSVLEKCKNLGIEGRHVFAMQGPFSEELNYAMLKEIHAAYLVTKESGKSGGFEEKIQAANRAGVTTIVIGRPQKESGYSCDEMIRLLQEKSISVKRKVTLVGIGTGSRDMLTLEAERAIRKADLICGADRMVEAVQDICGESADFFKEYAVDVLFSYMEEHIEYKDMVIVYSGDIGFFSGAKKMLGKLQETSHYECQCIPGIASPIYLMAKLGISWEDVCMTSVHGREENLIGRVREHRKVVTLLGGERTLEKLCQLLLENQLEQVEITVGERLSYEDEKILTGKPEELLRESCDSLSVAYIENPMADGYIVTHGIEDEQFLRGKAPMTKMEVRSVSLSKLQLTLHAVCYDIGAGTGSISIEMARQASLGMVYAIEKESDACNLMEQNQKKFGITNMKIQYGRALDVMDTLPTPTHAFIGGSSGDMEEILQKLFSRNPKMRVVINVITLDTLSQILQFVKNRTELYGEYVQLNVSKNKEVGNYQMMMGQNPVYVITISAR